MPYRRLIAALGAGSRSSTAESSVRMVALSDWSHMSSNDSRPRQAKPAERDLNPVFGRYEDCHFAQSSSRITSDSSSVVTTLSPFRFRYTPCRYD